MPKDGRPSPILDGIADGTTDIPETRLVSFGSSKNEGSTDCMCEKLVGMLGRRGIEGALPACVDSKKLALVVWSIEVVSDVDVFVGGR